MAIYCLAATTNADGTYVVQSVSSGSYKVQFSDASGQHPSGYYGPSGLVPTWDEGATVMVSTANVTGIDVRFPASYTVSGHVTAPDGTPLAGIWVYACGAQPINCGSTPPVTTGADGSFTLSVVPGSYTFQAMDPANNYVPAFLTGPAPNTAPTALDIQAPYTGVNIAFAAANHISGAVAFPASLPGIPVAAVMVGACLIEQPDVCFGAGAPPSSHSTSRCGRASTWSSSLIPREGSSPDTSVRAGLSRRLRRRLVTT